MHAHWFGWFTFALTVAIAFILSPRALEDRKFAKLVCGWLCVAVHPGWWNFYSGDCGISRTVDGSLVTAGAVALSVGFNWFLPFGRLRPLVRAFAAAGAGILVFFACVGMLWPISRADEGLQECNQRRDRNRYP